MMVVLADCWDETELGDHVLLRWFVTYSRNGLGAELEWSIKQREVDDGAAVVVGISLLYLA